ncbi:MAG TPA: leucine-rich repeat domain-containing protein [Bacteroidota bacterium]|nr:leucine-rich repeat domain-containing protein [Bacteroidota bacterium]
MNIKQLHIKLRSTYTAENLHRITTKIINLYKNKQYGSISRIMDVVAEYTRDNEEHYTKAFYKLMMLYHPDRINHYLGEIEKHYAANDTEELQRYSHIFPVIDLEQTLTLHDRTERPAPSPDEYEPEQWDEEAEGFTYRDTDGDEEDENDEVDELDPELQEVTFFASFKRVIYGNQVVDMPTHYLQDIDTIEMAGYEITDLDGIRYCEQLVVLDISNNNIIDISELSYLVQLNELYLADNQVSFVDALEYMKYLRIVDLSNNDIEDISPLFDLEHLEFVNIVGNRVPESQISVLEKKGVMIIR